MFLIQPRNVYSFGRYIAIRARKVSRSEYSAAMNLLTNRALRSFNDHSSPLRSSLLHPLSRPFLGIASCLSMELRPQELLHFLFDLHRLNHAQIISANEGKRTVLETRRHLRRGRAGWSALSLTHIQKTRDKLYRGRVQIRSMEGVELTSARFSGHSPLSWNLFVYSRNCSCYAKRLYLP